EKHPRQAARRTTRSRSDRHPPRHGLLAEGGPMKLGLRIFLAYLLIFAVCAFLPVRGILQTLMARYLESVEEPLVDTANLLAGLLEQQIAAADFQPADLQQRFAHSQARVLAAQIYNLRKTAVDLQVYVTNAAGTVVFDTREPSAVG